MKINENKGKINEKKILDRKLPEAIWKKAQVLMPKFDCQAAIKKFFSHFDLVQFLFCILIPTPPPPLCSDEKSQEL